jgi:hypothetical protein
VTVSPRFVRLVAPGSFLAKMGLGPSVSASVSTLVCNKHEGEAQLMR